MKCLVKGCSAEIDELREFPPAVGPRGEKLERYIERFDHEKELTRWTHVTLTANCSACVVLLAGHVCPNHELEEGRFSIEELVLPVAVSSPHPDVKSNASSDPKTKTAK
jgi:hypothetical protein